MKLKSLTCAVLVASSIFALSACNDSSNAQEGNAAATASQTAAVKINKDSPFQDKVSYSLGASVGAYVASVNDQQKSMIGEVNQDLVIQGFIDSIKKQPALTEDEIGETLTKLEEQIRDIMEKRSQEEAQENLAKGQKFLEENGKREGVKTTESGLQYEVVKEGTGATPKPTDTVRVKYKGTVISGEVFDEQQEPISFPLSNIIPGWVEGLQLMKEGSIYKLYIPSDLAYGDMAAGQVIKPNSVLIFEVELVEVVPAEAEAGADSSEVEK